MVERAAAIQLIRSIVEVASLCSLGLDGFQIVANGEGAFAFAKDDEVDEIPIMQKMREVVAGCLDLEFAIDVMSLLPATMEGIHFASLIIGRFKEFNVQVGASVLLFVSTLSNFSEIAIEIARNVIELTPKLSVLPERVIKSFLGEALPELSLFETSESTKSERESGFDRTELIRDLTSPMLPLRARGLFNLRMGVLTVGHPLRDEKMLQTLFPTIERQLQNDDTYVYLSAINCLESIAIVFPQLVVKMLTDQFPHPNEGLSLQIGQVLMLCAQRNGPGLVHSPDGNLCGCFIAAYARGCAHESDLVQASSLSNLASYVEALHFGVAPWFTDIVRTVHQMWQAHCPLQVRRAAAYLAYKCVKIFGADFSQFSVQDLDLLIAAVKRVRDGEFDEVSHQNAEDCYQLLWDICPMRL
jgi:hypothetical protein